MTAITALHPPRFGVFSLPEFEQLCNREPEAYVVQDLVPESSVNIAVGDSGLGKSAFAYQMALCVASGVPFLGHPVRPGRVLYIDLENGRTVIQQLYKSLTRHLGIALPEDFHLLTERDNLHQLEAIVKQFRPVLVIIDSLRAWRPDAESKNEKAASMVNELRKIAKMYHVSFLIIHHVRKPGENGAQSLEYAPTMTWLLEGCGARALINQTDVRLAFDRAGWDETGLFVKGFARLRGEIGPLCLSPDFDEEGEALGYRRMTGLELLPDEQQTKYHQLPDEFTFKEAKAIYGRQDEATKDVLIKCIRIGILRKVARGKYQKVKADGVSGVTV
jgi:hypothetical protein